MIGYKAFDKDLKCRGFQFEVGKTYKKNYTKDQMECCTNTVFHFCRELIAIERESTYKLRESRICEVIADGEIVRDGDKFGTNKITILREIVGDEKDSILNSGNWNSGNWNSGNCNSGDCNSGNWNSGDCNSGNWNSGNWNSGYWNSGNCNSGNRNSGNCNSGDWNSGNRNSGDCNSGNWNSGDCNSGYFNSDISPVRIFNKDTDIKREDIIFPNFFYFDLTVFVSYDTASDEERKKYKNEIETCGGFLKTISYKDAWRKSWDKASYEDKRKVLTLPNWDNEIFLKITGIDVEKELGIK